MDRWKLIRGRAGSASAPDRRHAVRRRAPSPDDRAASFPRRVARRPRARPAALRHGGAWRWVGLRRRGLAAGHRPGRAPVRPADAGGLDPGEGGGRPAGAARGGRADPGVGATRALGQLCSEGAPQRFISSVQLLCAARARTPLGATRVLEQEPTPPRRTHTTLYLLSRRRFGESRRAPDRGRAKSATGTLGRRDKSIRTGTPPPLDAPHHTVTIVALDGRERRAQRPGIGGSEPHRADSRKARQEH